MHRTKSCILLFLLAAILGWTLSTPSKVSACTGVELNTIEELVDSADVIVKARVVEVDDAGQNGILRVEQYYKGTGAEHLLFVRVDPIIITLNMRGYETCIYLENALHSGDIIYATGIHRRPGYVSLTDTFIFPTLDSTQSIDRYVKGEHNKLERLDVTESQLITMIETLSGNTSVAMPQSGTPYPNKVPLVIKTTESLYMLPIDGGAPFEPQADDFTEDYQLGYVAGQTMGDFASYLNSSGEPRCFEAGCIAGSSDGTAFVQLEDGYAVFLSPDGRFAAIWMPDNTIQIHRGYFYPSIIQSTALSTNKKYTASSLAPQSAWSTTNVLAFSDLRGLWLWNVQDGKSKPQLVIRTRGGVIPYPRYFSPRGRYLAITEGGTLSTFDTVSGERLPDGIFSPDERMMLSFRPSDTPGLMTVDECELIPLGCLESAKGIKQVVWTGANSYLMLGIPETGGRPFNKATGYMLFDHFTYVYIWRDYPDYIAVIPPADNPDQGVFKGWSFVYEPATRSVALLKDKHTLIVNKVEHDLSQHIKGDIVKVWWLPSLLFYER